MGGSLVPEYQDPGLFDVLEERIFIIDVHTFELLFMNRVARQKFHLDRKDYQGRKCYEVLRRRDAPCMDCGGAGIRNGTCRWNTYNPIFNEYHQLTDTFIHYQGHEARVEMAVDITQQMQQSQELITALALETVMTEAVRILYASLDLPQAICDMLRYIGNHLMADRAYIFEIQGDSLYNRFAWCGVDITPKPAVLPAKLIKRWLGEFQQNRVVCVPNLAAVRQPFPEEHRSMENQQVYSYIAAPLLVHEKIVGFIGLDNPPPDRIKNLDSMLMTLAYFVSASMVAAESRDLLEALSYSDVMTGVANRNAFARDLAQWHAAENLQPVGVAYIDLNGLKRVNDSQGHRAGDRMIVSLAETIARFFRKNEIYRTGGDEFVVICSGITQAQFMDRVTRLSAAIQGDAAVGFDWRDSNRDIQKAVVAADAAMYEQKKQYYMAEQADNAVAGVVPADG